MAGFGLERFGIDPFGSGSVPTAPALPTVLSLSVTNGPEFTYVIVTGTAFTNDTTLYFNGVAALYPYYVNGTTITCLMPSQGSNFTGWVSSYAVNTVGTGPTLSNAFKYSLPNLPTVTSIVPSSGLYGDAITIFGTDFTSDTTVQIESSAVTGLVYVDSGTITGYAPNVGSFYGWAPAFATNLYAPDYGNGPTLNDAFQYDNPLPQVLGVSPGSGYYTNSVTITGLQFTSDTLVYFGAVVATSIVFVNSTTITCDVPSNGQGFTGYVDMYAANDVGTGPTLSNGFLYTNAPLPTVLSVSPTTGITGDFVTITGLNFTSDTTVYFGAGIVHHALTGITYVNSTTITGYAPSFGTGYVSGYASNLFGTGSLADDVFRYLSFVSVANASSIDCFTTWVYFSGPVDETSALTSTNYTINNGITVNSVTKITDITYQLNTSRQTISTSYNLTATVLSP